MALLSKVQKITDTTNNKILITGGAGFIGSNLSNKLVRNGYHVVVLDNLSQQIHGNNPDGSYLYKSLENEIEFIRGDIRDRDQMQELMKNVDILIHLSAETGTGQSMYSINNYVDVNELGTANILHTLINSGNTIKKFILASSRSVYGEGKYKCKKCGIVYPQGRSSINMDKKDFNVKCPYCEKNVNPLPTDENSKVLPSSIYAVTKYNQEELVRVVCTSIGIPYMIYRFQNVYGPGQSLQNPYTGIISIFSNQIRNENDIEIYEDGDESRDFVFIDDVVDALMKGVTANESNMFNNIYNIGSGTSTTVLEISRLLRKKLNSNININITGNYRVGDIRHNYADIEKSKRLLGFDPKFNIDLGLSKFIEWVRQQPIFEDKYGLSISDLKNKDLLK